MENHCRIEISDDSIVVEVDGVRAEARGDLVDGVKRAVALHLLRAMADAPHLAEQNRQRELACQFQGENAQRRFDGAGAVLGGVARAYP